MKAVKIIDNELSQVKKGEVINFVSIKEKTKNIYGDDMLLLDLGKGNETYIIADEYKIENDQNN